MAQGKSKDFAWELSKNLPTLNKPRTDFIALFLLSILKVGTVNLVKVAIGMHSKAGAKSNYRRIQRFITQVRWCYEQLVPLILKWSGIHGPLTLVIDRTNWKLGGTNINILCISALGENFCVPIIWTLLSKKGISSQQERIKLMSSLVSIEGLPKIKLLIGDREFIGNTWFKYLKNNNIGILIRIKETQTVKRNKKVYSVSSLIKGNTHNKRQCNGKQYWIEDMPVYIHGFQYQNHENKMEKLIIASFEKPLQVSTEYSNRWYIECMFKNFKTNGFNLEQTHVTHPERLETLFGLLTLGYVCAVTAGKIIEKEKPELFKISANGRPKLSVFKAGFQELMCILLNNMPSKWKTFFKFLSCA